MGGEVALESGRLASATKEYMECACESLTTLSESADSLAKVGEMQASREARLHALHHPSRTLHPLGEREGEEREAASVLARLTCVRDGPPTSRVLIASLPDSLIIFIIPLSPLSQCCRPTEVERYCLVQSLRMKRH